MTSKGLVGVHWLSLVWLIIILVLSAVTLYETMQAQKAEDPSDKINTIQHLSIASVVFVSILIMPLLYWVYKQSKIGFGSDMMEVVF